MEKQKLSEFFKKWKSLKSSYRYNELTTYSGYSPEQYHENIAALLKIGVLKQNKRGAISMNGIVRKLINLRHETYIRLLKSNHDSESIEKTLGSDKDFYFSIIDAASLAS